MPISDSSTKNYPDRSEYSTFFESCIVNLLTPAKTIFFAISIPKAPNPLRNTVLYNYFLTLSFPVVAIYLVKFNLFKKINLDHLSSTISYVTYTFSYDDFSSYPVSISSKFYLVSIFCLGFGFGLVFFIFYG